jgi:hypothetical protein
VTRVVALVLLFSLGLFGGQARAARLTVTLDYNAGTGCPDAADFEAVVIARLGYDPFVPTAPDHVLVRIESRGSALNGRVEWRDASGKWTGDQTFPTASSDCPHLARVMGFALAVEIQLLSSAGTAPALNDGAPVAPKAPPEATRAVPKPPSPPPASEPTAVSTANVEAPPAGGPRPAFALGAGPSVGVGMSSGPVLLGRLFGGLAWRRLSLELGAVASLPATTRRPDGAGFSQQHLLGSAAACGTAARWAACVVANAGEVRMTGENIDRPNSASAFVFQTGARVEMSQPLDARTRLRAYADGLVNLARWTATLDHLPVWTAPRFAAALGVEAAVSFP